MYGVPLVGSTLCSALCLRGVTGGEDGLNLRALDVVARDGWDVLALASRLLFIALSRLGDLKYAIEDLATSFAVTRSECPF